MSRRQRTNILCSCSGRRFFRDLSPCVEGRYGEVDRLFVAELGPGTLGRLEAIIPKSLPEVHDSLLQPRSAQEVQVGKGVLLRVGVLHGDVPRQHCVECPGQPGGVAQVPQPGHAADRIGNVYDGASAQTAVEH